MLYTILILLILSIVFNFINKMRIERIKNNPDVQQILKEVQSFLANIENLKSEYFTHSLQVNLKNTHKNIYQELSYGKFKKTTSDEIKEFKIVYDNLENLVKQWNKEYVDNELIKNSELLSNIDGKSLDDQQRRAVVVDEDNNLILAGAGSGKTLTISGKVKYLVDVKGVNPEEILLISFTRKAADEMNERISKRLGIEVESKTFHKLGLDIIKKQRGERPDISENLSKVIDNYFKSEIYYDLKTLESLVIFFGYYINIPKEIESFENLGEYYKYCKNVDFRTLKGKYEIEKNNKLKEKELKSERKTIRGEQVKSIEEVIIANYLYLNGINYVYEYKYPYSTGDKYRKAYRPDFYLPDYDIYIEHFGINRNYKAPWLSKIEEEKYIEGVKWKRELHKQYNTNLVETYSYYKDEGILLDKLEEKLSDLDVEFRKIDYKEIYDTIFDNKEDRHFKELRKLIATFIGLFKSNGYNLDDFDNLSNEAYKIKNRFLKERSLVFLSIVRPIYVEYQSSLENDGEIDFNDMINESTDIVRNGSINFKYKYIIIDEYQDISKSRFNLIKEIKNQTNAKLMCVGDDWQSIYRFTGSDVDLFTNFEKHVGYYELLKIEKTYRNSQELIDIAGEFVMKNKKQLRKNLKSGKSKNNPIKIINYNNDIYGALEKCIDDIICDFGSDAEITILGRNNFDIEILSKESTCGKYEIVRKDGDIVIKSRKNTKIKINYLTAHKSKGLEADNVIIINLENKITGFPNQITDDPILNLVLTQSDNFEFAEERRLFYVALTRTKNRSYLLVPEMKSSIFCDELVKNFNIKCETIEAKEIKHENKCPKCLNGNLVKINSTINSNDFIGCTNYPLCDFKSNTIKILDSTVICKSCSGYMVKRIGRGEAFLGCTNYPYCKNTEAYNESKSIDSNSYADLDKNENYEYYDMMMKKQRIDYYNVCNEFAETEVNAIMTEVKYQQAVEKQYEKDTVNKNVDTDKELKEEIDSIKDNTKTIELYIKYKREEPYKYYKTCRVNTSYKVGDIFNDNNKEFIITDIYINTIFIQIQGEKQLENYKYKKYKEDKVTVKCNDLDKSNTQYIENKDDSITSVKEELSRLKSKQYIALNKKLWLEGFIKYLEGNKLHNIFNKEELEKIIYYNKLMRDEWFFKNTPHIEMKYFNNYKLELILLEKQIKDNTLCSSKHSENQKDRWNKLYTNNVYNNNKENQVNYKEEDHESITLEENWHMMEYEKSMSNYDILNLYPDIKSLIK